MKQSGKLFSTMQQTRKLFSKMQLFFTLITICEIIAVVIISWGAAALLENFFSITLVIPMPVLLILFSAVVGGVTNAFINHYLFAPISRLGQAMSQVAAGNFNTHLDTNNYFQAIQDTYANFNLMTQELRATEILQTDFVSNVSHEFKTPISAIEGYATLLQNGEPSDSKQNQLYVDKILLNTRRLSHLVGNILLLSKVDNQAIQNRQTTFRLDEQIRQSIVMLEPEWAAKDIEFDVELEAITYHGNELLLPHVWSNLIGNAIKFNPFRGQIRVALFQEDTAIVCTVADTGPGVSDAVKKHMFDKFYQGDSSHKELGNGLGLALVKQILTVCGGSISVENLSQGGCCFTVSLPLYNQRM